MPMPRLATATLGQIPPGVAVPAYDRHARSSGIVHIGPGNFHRAHQGFYLDALRSSGDLEWGMREVGVMPGDASLLRTLAEQDGLYSIRERSATGSSHRVSGAISEVNRPGDPQQIMEWLSDPTTRIVTLTITEGGYFIEPRTGRFRADDPAIEAEWEGDQPRNVFGFLVRALARRRSAGVEPFTLVSCDNLMGNGHAAAAALTGFARAWDEPLADWLAGNVATPATMVDGITPSATAADRDAVAEVLGVEDRAVVTCEPFRQWVIEDEFPTGRPRWEDVGAELVTDVTPFEHMKLRLLNAAHQVMAHLGALAGLTYIHDACLDPDIGGFLETFWDKEAKPMCPAAPGMNRDEYCHVLRQRFSNPGIADTITRNVTQASDRIPGFLLPTVADNLAAGGPIDAGALVVAAWARCLVRRDEQGQDLIAVDDRLDELLPLVRRRPELPLDLLDHPQLALVGSDPRFRDAFARAYESLVANGAKAAARAVTR